MSNPRHPAPSQCLHPSLDYLEAMPVLGKLVGAIWPASAIVPDPMSLGVDLVMALSDAGFRIVRDHTTASAS